ncbi:hypothetical protein DFA_05376 [Cavenderia fasciculata]|uniref:Amino acid transporter transmembrane domain-containing protein n=1 Tax=Cavenderia fasciculata TaxID=261658 RepID=F4PL22_CACFS|nr:uncharacterized protein DFA_05376 [Cavenderia fasciculata]EGG23244.1 hypothetical protein DFA_05376 [Cavenderia fasciculata]|eukprot:XP_004361095.1 hypothetical protein DFA_05376 [Cavenderia fasciculata]
MKRGTNSPINATERSPLVSGADQSYNNGADQSSIDQTERKFTPVSAAMNTIKSFAGAGSFALPWAMSNAGVFIGSIGLVLIALLANYTMTLLLKCNIKLSDEQLGSDQPPPSYSDLARRAFGRVGELIVCFINFSVTMSICIAYLILIGANLEMLTNSHISSSVAIWIVLPIIVALSWVTDMKYLGFTSIFGAAALILAMITVITYGIKDYSVEPLSHYKVDYANIPLWFGVAAFFFCNHIVVVPISHASGDYRRYPSVLNASMVFITIINILFTTLGYLYFNFATVDGVVGVPSNIVMALPNGIFANIVRACVIAELICSFPIIVGAGLNVVDSSLEFFHNHFSAFPNNNKVCDDGSTKFFSRNWKFYVIRVIIIGILAAIGTTIKTFGSYTSLIGSLMLAIAGFVIPPLLYIRFFPEQSKLSTTVHIIITVFGVAATILGTYQSIDALIKGN